MKKELKNYSKILADKRAIVAVSKTELLNDEIKAQIKSAFKKAKITPIFFSSVTRENLDKLLQKIFELNN